MKIKFIFCFFLFFGFNLTVKAQEYNVFYKKLEDLLLLEKNEKIINIVDSLTSDTAFSKEELNNFKVLKVEAMVKDNHLTDALKLSNKILSEPKYLSKKTEAQLRIEKALIFEILDNTEATFSEFKKIENIYKNTIKDEFYGRYLYRKSSFYRVTKSILQNDSLGLDFAEKAAVFGDKNNYYEVSGTGKFLQSYFHRNNIKKREQFLKAALKDFKLLKSQRNMAMVYLNLGKLNLDKVHYFDANKYLDSTILISLKIDEINMQNHGYRLKAILFEEQNKLDSALFYVKKFYDLGLKINLKKQSNEVAQIHFENEIEKQKTISESDKKRLLLSEKNNNLLLIFITGIFFLLIIIILLYRRITKKNNELKVVVSQKEILLKELNHRVKNNLSLIISLIKFQSQEISDSFYKDKFNHLENRISTIAIAHEQFVYSDKKLDGEFYNLEEYLQKISNALINTSPKEIFYTQNIAKMQLSIDLALPIGILMNELISNSIEHTVVKNHLKINTKITINRNWITIHYSDNGEIFKIKENSESLGLFIIDSMIKQLKGSYQRTDATYTIKLKQKNDD